MKLNTKILLYIFFVFCSIQAKASEESYLRELKDPKQEISLRLKTLLDKSCLNNKNIGIHIDSLDKGGTIFALNNNKLFTPASNVKLVTSAAALKLLEPDYRFTTMLYTDGIKSGGTINGNIYLKGHGDPFFVSEEMWLMTRELVNQGINQVTGDLVVDDSYFDQRRMAKGWKNPGSQAYNAQVGATSFNFNTFTVYVSPGARIGSRPTVIIDPESEYIKVSNSAITVKPWMKNKIFVNRSPTKDSDTVIVKGKIASTVGRKRFILNVTDPPMYVSKVFRKFLKKSGIHVKGKTRFAKAPKDVSALVEHKSKPLQYILGGLNKYSNNFTAEQILKTMGAEKEGAPGTFEKGLNQVMEYLESIGVKRGTYKLEDGSGLSHLNLLSPRQIVTVLKDVYSDFKIRAEYLSSLSIMGIDGSTRKRLKEEGEMHFKVRVKTGTLNGVSSLSGYISAKSGEVFVFSMLINYKNGCSSKDVTDLQDDIVREVSNFKGL